MNELCFQPPKFFVHNYLSGKTKKTPAGVGMVAILVSDKLSHQEPFENAADVGPSQFSYLDGMCTTLQDFLSHPF